MSNVLPSLDLLRWLADEQRSIQSTYRYVIELTDSLPGSNVPWDADRLRHAFDPLRLRKGETVPSDPNNPYVQYDELLTTLCGHSGYARVGDTVGIRDQAAAKAFLRALHPALTKQSESPDFEFKVRLAGMITQIQPNKGIVEELQLVIGSRILTVLDEYEIAGLMDRIYLYERTSVESAQQEIIEQI